MKKILASVLALLGMSAPVASDQTANERAMVASLRAMALELTASEIGVTKDEVPGDVWGLVMETGTEEGFYTLVVLADGSTSLYFSNGGGIIGAGDHQAVRDAGKELIGLANRFVGLSRPSGDVKAPALATTQFFFLTFEGRRVYSVPERELAEQRDALAPLFFAGHSVIAAARHSANEG